MWLGEPVFYIYGVVYVLARFTLNIPVSVQPFYLNQVVGFEQTKESPTPVSLAIVPMIQYIVSMLFSIFF
jgi:hypothetical protein